MRQEVQAVYENGLLRPLQPLSLCEHERVAITVESGAEQWLDVSAHECAVHDADGAPSLEMVRQQLSAISGCLSDTITSERGEY